LNIKPIDNRKYPFKNYNKEYILKLKTEQLEQINKIIELENIKIIKLVWLVINNQKQMY
jgi:hypothetical protein